MGVGVAKGSRLTTVDRAIRSYGPLRGRANIGLDTKSLTLLLVAARFCPQRSLALRTMSQDLIGCWNHGKLKRLFHG